MSIFSPPIAIVGELNKLVLRLILIFESLKRKAKILEYRHLFDIVSGERVVSL